MLVNPLRPAYQIKRHRDHIRNEHNQFGRSRPNRNRERNRMASRKPGNERQCNSENDKHENSGSGLETFIAQKYAEGAAIKQQAGDQNKIP
jgi:hypothetical protein